MVLQLISLLSLLVVAPLEQVGSEPELFAPTTKYCGVSSAVMFIGHHSEIADADAQNLMHDFELSELGTSVADVRKVVARHVGNCEIFNCSVDQLESLKLPILVFKQPESVGHFYLIVGWNEKYVTITDGSSFRREFVEWAELERQWSGVVLGVKQEPTFFEQLGPYVIVAGLSIIGIASVVFFKTRGRLGDTR